MHLTDEQSSIINYRGQKLVVEARAGSGKTFTLVKYAEANPQERMLYLAYNRAIRDEGASKFPRNVVCKTSHRLAFAAIGRNFRHKLTNNLRLTDIAKAANTNNWQLARDVQDTLNTFMCSADTSVEPQHFVRIQRTETTKQEKYKAMVLDIAKRLWNRMIDPTAEFSITHDGYLKLYQLKKPDLSRQYSTILFDEAQDANEVTSDIVMSQKAKVIMVGDSHQQIYRYRGAEDALQRSEMKDADRLFLTNSFRFGSRIALVSNLILALKGEKRPTMGMADQDKIVTEIPEGLPHVALLHRTVMGTIESALEAAGRGKKVYWVGGIDSYQIGELEDLFWFSRNQKDRVRSKKLLDEYNDYETYEHIAKESDDVEMKRAVVMLGRYENLPAKLQQLK